MQTIWLGYMAPGITKNNAVNIARHRCIDIPPLTEFISVLHESKIDEKRSEYWITLENKDIPTPDEIQNPSSTINDFQHKMGIRKKHPHKYFKSEDYDPCGKYQYD